LTESEHGSPAQRLRILQIVPTLEQEASGPSHSVPLLCRALGQAGHEVILSSVGGVWFSGEEPYTQHTAPRDFKRVPVLKSLWLSSGLRRSLAEDARWADIVHSNSLWVMPNVYPAAAARRAGKPYVVSPRGTLSPVALARSYAMKRAFWMLLQGRAVRNAVCLHATSEQEYRDIRRFGLSQPVAIVANGVSIPLPETLVPAARGLRTLLYLGRLHPIKGLDNLLKAWHRIAAQFQDWQLRLVGPADAEYLAYLEGLANELELKRIVFAGPRYGAEKQAEYAAADLYVLPSYTENFGMSVAEALACAVPVITTVGTPWQRVRELGCGWLVSPNVAGIESALREALSLDRQALAAMGQGGRAWMEREFAWSRIAGHIEQTYRWLLRGGSVPDCVRLD
jgi:glycosyltransferase involved in cell wall biosynthesis